MMKFRSSRTKSKDSRSSSTKPEYFKAKPETSQMSPRSVASSHHDDYSNDLRRPFEGAEIRVPIAADGSIRSDRDAPLRSLSTGRQRQSGPPQSASMRIVGRGESDDAPTPRRAQSTGRAMHRIEEPVDSSEHSGGEKKRKSKMEKIRQLQAKNELYKDEFKRVQKDRKKLKKELEAKNNEITSLSKEIDSRIAETSRLKSKLSDAMMQIERTDEDEHRDKGTITKLAKELAQTKEELSAALRRVATLKEDITDLREYIRRKDEQIETLSEKVTAQEKQMGALNARNVELRQNGDHKKEEKMVNDLVAENKQLQGELGATLERAAKMVKEREDAIADLLRENDEMKEIVSKYEQKSSPEITHEELDHLREELVSSNAQLEQVQDRNVLLEEEIEAWLARGSEMEGMLDRLNNDLEAWQQKAKASDDAVAVMEGQVVDAKAATESSKEALRNAETRHQAAMADLEIKHKSVVLDMQEKMFELRAEKPSAESQQDMLSKAVADRQRKAVQQKSWRARFMQTGSEDDEDLNESQKHIKELENTNAAQEEEIKKLKSELVRLRSQHNEDAYMNKKKIERLSEENEAYAEKAAALQIQLSKAMQ